MRAWLPLSHNACILAYNSNVFLCSPKVKPRESIRTQSHHPPIPQAKERSKKPAPPTRPSEQAQKPKPVTKPSDVAREHKKQELHQKYSKIRDEILRKQGLLDSPSSTRAKGLASPTTGASPHVKERAHRQHGAGDYKEEVKAHIRPKPPKGHKHRSRPSYAEVEPDFEIRVEPVPNRISQSDADNTEWMRVKYPTMPKKGESRSSSSSNITSSDYYSNLAELQLEPSGGGATEGSGSDSMGRRRHSFSEGEERMIIRASTSSR